MAHTSIKCMKQHIPTVTKKESLRAERSCMFLLHYVIDDDFSLWLRRGFANYSQPHLRFSSIIPASKLASTYALNPRGIRRNHRVGEPGIRHPVRCIVA